jgi:predicted O-linked N-acetylglucosamine transferase (SPINDLY family)
MDITQIFELAKEHHEARRLDQAQSLYEQVLAAQPDHAAALQGAGILAFERGRCDEAVQLLQRAIALEPQRAQFHYNPGLMFKELGRVEEAIAAFERAAALEPNDPRTFNDLGIALASQRRLEDAVEAFGKAIGLRPDFVEAINNLGNALGSLGRLEEAVAACRRAIALRPDYHRAYSNLGNSLWAKGEQEQAIAACEKALSLRPNSAEACNNLANALKDVGRLDEAVTLYGRAVALRPQSPEFHSNLIFALHYCQDQDAASLLEEMRRWNQRHARPRGSLIRRYDNDRDERRRLRIGYISPDFHSHSVGRFLLPLFAHHDHEQVEIFAYSDVLHPDQTTQRLQSGCDHWRDIRAMSDRDVDGQIHRDRIDILVDLSLHTAGNRLLVFAQKPAPLQVTYLAYCSSSGLDTMDYRLTDPHLDPPGIDEKCYSEATMRLPRTYWCYEPDSDAPPVGPLAAETSGGITFGCFNNYCKVSPGAWEAWYRLLSEVPRSRLAVYSPRGSHRESAYQNLSAAGIDRDRLSFVDRMPLGEFFARHDEIDVALDPFPYGGGTTTCDALWMGVPVVTLRGRTAVGRAGASLLSNVGLPELIGGTVDQYVRIARDLAADRPRLAELRRTLRQRMAGSPLMDAAGFARDVESALRQMWRRWCQQV